jgi:hypothetical protein
MEVRKVSRRGLCTTLFATVVGALMTRLAVAAELSLPMNLPEQQFTFDDKGIEGWTTVSGQWAVEEMAKDSSRSSRPPST